MAIVVEATYEDGVLKPAQPLPLKEHEKVKVTVDNGDPKQSRWRPLIDCDDEELIEKVALDPELDF